MYVATIFIRDSYVDKSILKLKKVRQILLFPLGWCYGAVAYLRRRLYSKKSYTPSIPTICVGNLALGGTGKTPHVEYLIRLISKELKTAVLSRGYKRQTKGFISSHQSYIEIDARTIGDEPMQYLTKFPDLEVVVCENRAEGIEKMVASANAPQVVVLDDAYQHLKVNCGLKILLTEYSALFTNDYPVPAGNLREFRSNAKFADVVVVTKTPKTVEKSDCDPITKQIQRYTTAPVFFSAFSYLSPIPLTNKAKMTRLMPNTKVLLLTGIAHPQSLLEYVQTRYSHVELLKFPDHYAYSEKDVEEIFQRYHSYNQENTIILTTEKDAVRLMVPNLKKVVSLLPIFSIPIEVEILFEQEVKFNQIIQDYVGKNERNSFVLGTKN